VAVVNEMLMITPAHGNAYNVSDWQFCCAWKLLCSQVPVSRSGTALDSVVVVTLHRARLVRRWVTILGQVNYVLGR